MLSTRIQITEGGNLDINNVQRTDEGKYQCLAINIAGTRMSPEVTLAVHRKFIFVSI